MSEVSTDASEQPRTQVSIDGLRTYLACPKRYEFAHVHELATDDEDDPLEDRVELCRRAICSALQSDHHETETLVSVALERLASLWDDHEERFHSRAQRRHEQTVLEATVRAYFEAVGTDHARRASRLAAESGGELVGPDIPLTRTASSGESTVELETAVDYVYGDDDTVVGVRFVPTLRPLGMLQYRSSWTGDVETLFSDHFDPERDTVAPAPVGTLFETSVALEGLRTLCERLDLERRCRYVQIPLAERSNASVNWVSGGVETTLDPVELTDVYVDEITYGMTHEHRNETVDERLEAVAGRLGAGAFDPADRWEAIEREACPDCAYAVCCGAAIGTEVGFDA